MNVNENDSSKKQKLKQGTLDSFVYTQKKTNSENASYSSPIGSSTHTNNDLNNQTQQTEVGTTSDSDDNTEFADGFHSQFDGLMKIINYCSTEEEHRHPLVAPLLCFKFMLHQGLEVVDNDEDSCYKLDVAGMLEMLSKYDENINEAVIKNAPLIQKDMISSCSKETTKSIVKDICGDYFAILVDKYDDIEHNEQIALCLRYVDKEGDVVERFLGITNVMDSTALSLKSAIYSLIEKHSLNMCNIRGQGYNAVSNMYGDISGLQTLIKKETQSAYYIHCFANHLQHTLVEISKESVERISWFFCTLEDFLHVVILSWKENEVPRESRFQKAVQALEDSIIEIGYCLFQKVRMGRLNDDGTCLGPYYKLVLNVIEFYPVILEMLSMVWDEPPLSVRSKLEVSLFLSRDPLDTVENFDFVFVAHVIKTILEVTNELSMVLQKKDENIAKAMSLLKLVKERLKIIRDEGWETLLSSVILFCNKNDIKVPSMEDMNIPPYRYKRGPLSTTNLHHCQVEVFFATIDLQLQELNSRFDEVNMELLVCMGSLSPVDSFCSFDKQKLLRLAECYPKEFSSNDLHHLNDQLDNYINDVRKDKRLMGLKDLKELSKKLVEVKKHEVYNLVYLLIRLVLILPIATASVERAFSAMTFVKKELQSKVSNELLNHRLVTYIESDVLSKISNDDIISNFESMKTLKEKL